MAVSLQKSMLRRVEYVSFEGATCIGWFHKYVLRKGDYVGYSKGALVETVGGKLIILKLGEFKYVDGPTKRYRRLIFINDKGATEVGFFHHWVRRRGKFIGVDIGALIEKKTGELLVYPYNEVTFVDTDT
jgi:hypothetical protein